MFDTLASRLHEWSSAGRPDTVDDARDQALRELAHWIAAHPEGADLVWVCTHNSRRSHIAQLWAHAAAQHHQIPQVRSFSGGTEATAFFPSAIAALRDHGFQIDPTGEGGDNPVYAAHTGVSEPVRSWSKAFTDPTNPQSGFAAIMVCTSADEACPVVLGADVRISLPYIDPKRADGSPDPMPTYRATSAEIGAEMAYLMSMAAGA